MFYSSLSRIIPSSINIRNITIPVMNKENFNNIISRIKILVKLELVLIIIFTTQFLQVEFPAIKRH